MAQISYIKYTDVLDARRYDAEYFKREYLESDKIIKTKDWKYLDKDIAEITGGNAFNSEGFGKGKIKVAKITEVSQDKDIEQWETISNEEINLFPKRFLQKGDILFSGTHHNYWDIGKVLFINFEGSDATFNQRVFRIRFKKEINPEFAFILFKTRFLRNQIEKFGRGNNQLNLNFTELNQFKIPLLPQFFQLQIEEIVKSAHQKQNQSKQLYREAEQLLLQEIGLLNYQIKHELTFFTTKKEIEQAHRYDSEYFQPKYAEIIKKIEEYDGGWDFVKNQFKQNTTLSKKDGDYCNYIEISDVNVSNGEVTPNRVEIKDIPANGKRKLFKNDLLISKVRPYRGAISFIDFEVDKLLGSGAFTVLQEKTDYKKEVLMIFLKTVFIKELLLRYNCGTSYPVIKDEDILNLKIPLIKPSIQKQIAEKIQESHGLRKESKELLEEAKRKVEEEIEK